MSLFYVNPLTQRLVIQEKLLDLLPLFKSLPNDSNKLFIILNKLSYLLTALYDDEIYSATDSVITANSVWKLFSPTNKQKYVIRNEESLNSLWNTTHNIFYFKLPEEYGHNFVLIRTDNWYLVQSYTYLYKLNGIREEKIPEYLGKILERDLETYNFLFNAELNSDDMTAPIYFHVEAGNYDELPLKRLEDKILLFL